MDYDTRLYETFHLARRLPPEMARMWMEIARLYSPGDGVRRILDLGSGTGRFSSPLAETFGCPVVGVEPSAKMREIARRECDHPDVHLVGGLAESIPAPGAFFDLAWLSMIVHHSPDIGACGREVFRVVRPGGRALVRNSFRGRPASRLCYEFFPSAQAVDEARLPSIEEARTHFGEAGFVFSGYHTVEQTIDSSFGDYLERARKRSLSTFDLIPEADFEEGIRRMEEAVRKRSVQGPIREEIDLLIFHRPG